MRYIIIVIISLLTSCTDKIYNTTTVIEAGAKQFTGKIIFNYGTYCLLERNTFDADKYQIVSRLMTYNTPNIDTVVWDDFEIRYCINKDSTTITMYFLQSERLPSNGTYRMYAVVKGNQ